MEVKFASLFLKPEHFDADKDPSSSTIGKAGLSWEIFSNRRKVEGILSPLGISALEKVKKYFEKRGVVDISFEWNIHCGCSMCPCSPGYNVYSSVDIYPNRYDVFVDKKNKLSVQRIKQ